MGSRRFTEFILLLGFQVFCSAEVDFNDINNQIDNLNISDYKQYFEEAKSLIRSKCEKESGNPDQYDKIEEGAKNLYQCLTGLVNVTILQKEVEEAKPIGELDTVFRKYCGKREEGVNCVQELKKEIVPCLNEQEKQTGETLVSILKIALDFVCHKDGDALALFIAEGGPPCLDSTKDAIGQCFNKTLTGYIPTEAITSLDQLPKLTFNKEQCQKINEVRDCIIEATSKCDDDTPSNMIEALFRYVKKQVPIC